MVILNTVIPLTLYLLFLTLGLFIIIQNPKRKVLWYFGGGIFCGGFYTLCTIMTRRDLPVSTIILWTKLLFVFAEAGTLLWSLTSIEFVNEIDRSKMPSKILIYFLIITNFLITYFLVFTNFFIDYKNPIFVNSEFLTWDLRTNDSFIIRIAFLLFKALIPVYFFIKLLTKHYIKGVNRRFLLVMIVASIFMFLGIAFSCFHYHLKTRYTYLYSIPGSIQELSMLLSMTLIGWTILSPKLMIREMLDVVNDFLSYIGYSLLLLVPYITLILVIFKYFNSKELYLIIILSISGLVLLTHSTHEWVVELIKRILNQEKLSVPLVLPSEINSAIKNLSTPHLLKSNRALNLPTVNRLSKQKGISKVEALISILTDSINYFKPKADNTKRTIARLKYEILRMIAFEGASESQIMWDLGFDVYTRSVEEKISENAKPRFPLKDASEYPATSQRSFKRIKKEAIEMLRWKLEEGEK